MRRIRYRAPSKAPGGKVAAEGSVVGVGLPSAMVAASEMFESLLELLVAVPVTPPSSPSVGESGPNPDVGPCIRPLETRLLYASSADSSHTPPRARDFAVAGSIYRLWKQLRDNR